MQITSLSNPRIKMIRKLRDRKARVETGLFYIEGLRIVAEAAQLGAEIETLLVAPDLLVSEFGQDMVKELSKTGVEILEISSDVFYSFAHKEGPQGLAAILHQRWTQLDTVQPSQGDLWVALDAVADPGNLGTILRTMDAVGGKGVILLDHSTDPYDTTATRASMGALFSQILIRATFDEFAAWKMAQQISLLGTSGAAEEDYHLTSYPDPLVVLMGSERMGLQPHHIALCDKMVKIPMAGRSDSLNLAVATGVVLYEVFNHRRGGPGYSGTGAG